MREPTAHAPDPEAFRQEYRSRLPAWYHGGLHLSLTLLLTVGLIIVFALQVTRPTPLEWLTIPLTFLYVNVFEYIGHRGPMHNGTRFLRPIYKRHTLEHHRFFNHAHMAYASHRDFAAVLFAPVLVVFFATLFVLPAWLLLNGLVSSNAAWLFAATVFAYFLNYELLHLAYHTPWCAKVPLLRNLQRHHLIHHHPHTMDQCNFNVTYPIADLLFGTHRSTLPEDDFRRSDPPS